MASDDEGQDFVSEEPVDSDDEAWVPEQHELAREETDVEEQQDNLDVEEPSGLESDYEASEGGYTTGATSDDEPGDLFAHGLNPIALLERVDGGVTSSGMEPFEAFRAARKLAVAAPETAPEHEVFGMDFDKIWQVPVASRGGRRKRKRSRRSNKPINPHRKISSLPQHISRKLSYAAANVGQGKFQEAVDLYREVLAEAPNILDAWDSLASCFAQLGLHRRQCDCLYVMARMKGNDSELWLQVARLSHSLGMLRQAVHCYGKVLGSDRKNHLVRRERALLLAELRQGVKAEHELRRILQEAPDREPDICKDLARLHIRAGNYSAATEVLEPQITGANGYSDATDLEHVALLVDCFLATGNLDAALRLIAMVEQGAGGGEGALPEALQVKKGIVLLNQRRLDDAAAVLHGALDECDLVLHAPLVSEVADQYRAAGLPEQELHYLAMLRELPECNNHTLWDRIKAACEATSHPEVVCEMYRTIVEEQRTPDDPEYLGALLELVAALAEGGQLGEAREYMERLDELLGAGQVHVPDSLPLQLGIMVQKHKLCLRLGMRERFVDEFGPQVQAALEWLKNPQPGPGAQPKLPKELARAVSRQVRKMRAGQQPATGGASADSHGVLLDGSTGRMWGDRRKRHVREVDAAAADYLSQQQRELAVSEMDISDEEEGAAVGAAADGQDGGGGSSSLQASLLASVLFRDDDVFEAFTLLCRTLVELRDVAGARQLVGRAWELLQQNSSYVDRAKRDYIRLLQVDMCREAEDDKQALDTLKLVCKKWPHSWSVWNNFCRICCHLGSTKWMQRFLDRIHDKCPTSIPRMMVQGHLHSMSKMHLEALKEYFTAYNYIPGEPLLLMCIGVSYINLAMTKRVHDRNRAVLLGFTFLSQYAQRRGNTQEALYNMGRAAHQLGLNYLAVEWYERALEAGPPATSDPAAPRKTDLTREIAFNLSLLYRNSGADDLARQLARTHLAVL